MSSQQLPPHLDASLEWVVEPDQVLEVRQTGKGNGAEIEVLIKSKDLPSSEAWGESAKSIIQSFSDFRLEDKVVLAGRGNDRPPIRFTYSRRTQKK